MQSDQTLSARKRKLETSKKELITPAARVFGQARNHSQDKSVWTITHYRFVVMPGTKTLQKQDCL